MVNHCHKSALIFFIWFTYTLNQERSSRHSSTFDSIRFKFRYNVYALNTMRVHLLMRHNGRICGNRTGILYTRGRVRQSQRLNRMDIYYIRRKSNCILCGGCVCVCACACVVAEHDSHKLFSPVSLLRWFAPLVTWVATYVRTPNDGKLNERSIALYVNRISDPSCAMYVHVWPEKKEICTYT